MNRRKFFTALAAVMAAPKLLKARARWIVPPWRVNPAWVTATHEVRFGYLNSHGDPYIVPIIYRRGMGNVLRPVADDVFKHPNERIQTKS